MGAPTIKLFSNSSFSTAFIMRAYRKITSNGTSQDDFGVTRVWAVTNITLCSVGVAINTFLLTVILSKPLRRTTVGFLSTIAVADLTTMLVYILATFVKILYAPCTSYPYWVAYILSSYDFFSVTVYGVSTWSTVAFMVYRAFTVTRRTTYCYDKKDFLIYFKCIGAILPGSVLCNLPAFLMFMPQLDLTRCHAPDTGQFFVLGFSAIRKVHPWIVKLSYSINGILFKLIPCILLFIEVTILLVKVMESHKQRKRLITNSERSVSFFAVGGLLVTLVVFLSTQFPNTVLNLQCIANDSDAQRICANSGVVQDMLSLMNSIILFPAICISNGDIRKHIKSRLRRMAVFCYKAPIDTTAGVPSRVSSSNVHAAVLANNFADNLAESNTFYINEEQLQSILGGKEVYV